MLYLDEKAIGQIVSMKEVMDGIDQAYSLYEKKAFNMPTRFRVADGENTLVLMPCFTEKYIATKLVTIFPGNSRFNMPALHGLIALHCNEKGTVQALMDGTFITGIRTGAVGGTAIRHLAREDVKRLAVIGAGVQGYFQTIAACEAREFEEVYIHTRTPGEKLEKFIQKLRGVLGSGVKIHAAETAAEAIQDADVIITATTSNDPVLPNDQELLRGKLIVGIGSFRPDMQEFPEALFRISSKMYIDTLDAIKEAGDIIVPLQEEWISRNDIQTFSSYLKEKGPRAEKDETIIFKSTGMALFDSVISSVIYEKAVKKNMEVRV